MVNRRNVRVAQRCCRARLAQETLAHDRGVSRARWHLDYFQCHTPMKHTIARPIRYAHAAVAELTEGAVFAARNLEVAEFGWNLCGVQRFLEKRCQRGVKKTQTTESLWRIREDGRTAFCAHALNFISLSTQWRSSLPCTDRKPPRSYACNMQPTGVLPAPRTGYPLNTLNAL